MSSYKSYKAPRTPTTEPPPAPATPAPLQPLQLASEAVWALPVAWSAPSAPATPALRVLCVDPSALDALLLQEVGEIQGCAVRVQHASDAASAWAALRGERPDLILVNPYVHDAEWRTLVAQLARLQSAPVWVWGGGGSLGEREDALASGAAVYLTKPSGYDGYAQLLGSMRRDVTSRAD